MNKIRSSHRVSTFTESVIREMTRLSHEHGALNLAQGFPDFDPPQKVVDAAHRAMDEGYHQYSVTWGMPELREAIAEKVGNFWGMPLDADAQITVTCGATEGMISALMSVLDPGDEIVIFEPFYENYGPGSTLAGAAPKYVTLEPPEFNFRFEELAEAVTDKTRGIIVNTPHNPTGRVFDREELEFIGDLCQKHDVICFTDEIYEHILYDGRQHISPATIETLRDRTIAVGGLSKTYSVTGWRLGYVIAPPDLAEGVRKVHDFLTVAAPTPLQKAAVTALNFPTSYYDELVDFYAPKREMTVEMLQDCGFRCSAPEGAYYILADVSGLGFEDDWEAARHLVKEVGVAGVPGTSFFSGGTLGQDLLRFAFCKTEETLQAVAQRLQRL